LLQAKLSGQRIALFESRLAAEICELVRRSGGVPVCASAVRERRRPAGPEVAALLDLAARESSPAFVFSTGVGTTALFDEARALGRLHELRSAISRGQSICRGPKPVAALHKEGIAASVKARTPYTTAEFVEALAEVDLRERMAVLVHYGERNEALVEALSSRGAKLRELVLYQWELPEDTAPLVRIVEELSQGAFAAAAFTTQIQARHLLKIADGLGRREGLLDALRSRVVVAAVGPTCARVLAELGIAAQVVPETPKMGAMVTALVARLAAGKAGA
jgi:uroporphyrinogen-III synthase